jgi:two-component system cell cycle sensor histidine kinase/response regulator CckA
MPTILLVDDDSMVISLCIHILTNAGWMDILPACDAIEALRVAGDHAGAIHLLLSDMVMPGGTTGVQLAESLTRARPEMKVLLMSAGSQEDFHFQHGWQFLAKPFRPSALVSKVQETLGLETYAQPVR